MNLEEMKGRDRSVRDEGVEDTTVSDSERITPTVIGDGVQSLSEETRSTPGGWGGETNRQDVTPPPFPRCTPLVYPRFVSRKEFPSLSY